MIKCDIPRTFCEQALGSLREWLKDKPYTALAYMTGILPIKKYDGYKLSIYSPLSVVESMATGQIKTTGIRGCGVMYAGGGVNMLRIYFGDREDALYGPTWFKYNYDPYWFKDELVQAMVREVDHTEYVGDSVFDSPVLGKIPPERLSGGVKTLIMIYKMPEKVFDATSCGANCAHMLLEIGKREDVTINLRYYMPMKGLDPFEIEISNTGKVVTQEGDYALAALDCLDEAGM